jgi:hypothetical protein
VERRSADITLRDNANSALAADIRTELETLVLASCLHLAEFTILPISNNPFILMATLQEATTSIREPEAMQCFPLDMVVLHAIPTRSLVDIIDWAAADMELPAIIRMPIKHQHQARMLSNNLPLRLHNKTRLLLPFPQVKVFLQSQALPAVLHRSPI